NKLVIGVQDRNEAAEVGNVHLPLVLIEAAGIANIAGERALIIQLHVINLHAIIVAVGDVDFGLVAQRAHPNSMARIEFAMLFALAAHGANLLKIFIET